MEGWFISYATANYHPYFHQWELKVPYKCAAPPLFRKFYCDGFLWFNFFLSSALFCLICAFECKFSTGPVQLAETRDTLQSGPVVGLKVVGW